MSLSRHLPVVISLFIKFLRSARLFGVRRLDGALLVVADLGCVRPGINYYERSKRKTKGESGVEPPHSKIRPFSAVSSHLAVARTPLGIAKSPLGTAKSMLGTAKIRLGGRKSILGNPRSQLGEAREPLMIAKTRLGSKRKEVGSPRTQLGNSHILCKLTRTTLIRAQLKLIDARTQGIIRNRVLIAARTRLEKAQAHPAVGMSLRLSANPQPHNQGESK